MYINYTSNDTEVNLFLDYIMKWTQRGSSPVDWCEQNYIISDYIAEFGNTITNLIFILIPIISWFLFANFTKEIGLSARLILLAFPIVGISSAYFHATLSILGQLLDELSILWLCMIAMAVLYPKRYLPKRFDKSRFWLGTLAFIIAIFGTVMSTIEPVVNAFVLMLICIPALVILFLETKRSKIQRVKRVAFQCTALWTIALICWISDRFFCRTWLDLSFPYLHGFWHIFSFLSVYLCFTLFCYFTVQAEYKDKKAVIKYWPQDEIEWGITYVDVK